MWLADSQPKFIMRPSLKTKQNISKTKHVTKTKHIPIQVTLVIYVKYPTSYIQVILEV